MHTHTQTHTFVSCRKLFKIFHQNAKLFNNETELLKLNAENNIIDQDV